MPRYFFDVFNNYDSHDEDGVELADLNAVRSQIRQTLPAMLRDIEVAGDATQYRIDVRDETGRKVVVSTIMMVIQEVEANGAGERRQAEDVGRALRRP